MIGLLLFVVILLVVVSGAIFVWGFRLGGEQGHAELAKVRLQAAQAERRLHNLTRDAFVRMAEAAERRREDQ